MDSATAALIGVGIGTIASLGAQFLGDQLATERDRRNQRRDRLHRVITEAALALYTQTRREPLTESELDAIDPESVAGQDPEMFLLTLRPSEAVAEAIVSLQVQLGHGHPLVAEYAEVAEVSLNAVRFQAGFFHSDDRAWRKEAIRKLLDASREAQVARDRWTTSARATVDGM